MTKVLWSRYGEEECIRLNEFDLACDVRVRPVTADVAGEMPAMAGRFVRDGEDACFLPRFPFVDGIAYSVLIAGEIAATLDRPRIQRVGTTEVAAIYPTAAEVPQNLLRLYIGFSAPMSEGFAARHVHLIDENGTPIEHALLLTDHELWDSPRRRLTVLLDPARIKRGLAPHLALGYPLQVGGSFEVVVDEGFCDAAGNHLRRGAKRRYVVGDLQSSLVEPRGWSFTTPPIGSPEPLELNFDRPLDHALLARCLHVARADRGRVEGRVEIATGEQTWRLFPERRWSAGSYQLVVDPVLEDLAGNSALRVFDRDLTRSGQMLDDTHPVSVPFQVKAH